MVESKKPAPFLYNLDAVIKEKEATAPDPFVFKYKRKNWTLLLPSQLDLKEALSNSEEMDNPLLEFEMLLGEEQWDSFPPISLEVAGALLDAYSEYVELVSADEESPEKGKPSDD